MPSQPRRPSSAENRSSQPGARRPPRGPGVGRPLRGGRPDLGAQRGHPGGQLGRRVTSSGRRAAVVTAPSCDTGRREARVRRGLCVGPVADARSDHDQNSRRRVGCSSRCPAGCHRRSWRPAKSGATLPVDDPATGEVLTEVADASAEDGKDARGRGRRRAARLRRDGPREARRDPAPRLRADHRADRRPGAADDPRDGEAAGRAKGEITSAAEFFRWFAEEAVGSTAATPSPERGEPVPHPPAAGRRLLLITPWNFPMAMGTRKIGPAVAAGAPW